MSQSTSQPREPSSTAQEMEYHDEADPSTPIPAPAEVEESLHADRIQGEEEPPESGGQGRDED